MSGNDGRHCNEQHLIKSPTVVVLWVQHQGNDEVYIISLCGCPKLNGGPDICAEYTTFGGYTIVGQYEKECER